MHKTIMELLYDYATLLQSGKRRHCRAQSRWLYIAPGQLSLPKESVSW